MANRRAWLLAAAALVAAAAGNTAFAAAYASDAGNLLSSRPAPVRGVAAAVAVNPSTVLVATLGDQIAIVRDGRVAARRTLDATVGGIAASADGTNYYAGTSLGTVYTLDAGLRTTSTRHLADAVAGLRIGSGGTLVVAHGAGQFGQNSTVDTYPVGTATVSGSQPVGSTVNALDVGGDTAVYGTLSGKVGMVALPNGRQDWQMTLPQAVTSIASVPSRRWVLAGDQGGQLNLLDAHGTVSGSVGVSEYPVTAVAYDGAHDEILTGDQNGTVRVLDGSGRALVTTQVAGSAVRALIPTGQGDYLALPQAGAWSTVDVAAARGDFRAQQLRPWWIAFDALLVAGLLGWLALTGRRRVVLARTGRRMWQGRLAYLMVAPTILLVAGLTFYPALTAFYYSFTNFSLSTVTHWVGLENYRTVFTGDTYFWVGLKNMAIVLAASLVKTVAVPLLAAELVFWLRNAIHQYVFRTLFVLSAVVPTLVVTLLWKQVYDPYGLINSLLSAVGLHGWEHAWLGDESTALWAVVGAGFPYLTAFPFLIFLGGLLTINREIYEAAAIDGAGRFRRFLHVDIAHLRPQFRIVAFLGLIGSVENIASIFVLTNGGPGTATEVPALEMYSRIGSGDLGYASAIGVILFAVIVAGTMFILRFRRSAMEVDA